MSNDYYRRKWKQSLIRLDNIVLLDLDYQETKAHDKKRCHAVQRLSGVLGEYVAIYNEAVDCFYQTLEVENIEHMGEVIKAIVARILELKKQIKKIESSNNHFYGYGLFEQKLTTHDVEFEELSSKVARPDEVQEKIENIIKEGLIVKEECLRIQQEKALKSLVTETLEPNVNWWNAAEDDDDDSTTDNKFRCEYEVEEKLSEETLKRIEIVSMIKSQEKTRQVTRQMTRRRQRRALWEKELKGMLQPMARRELRERASAVIQKVCRVYFELKRRKITDCKREELLGMKMCLKLKNVEQEKMNQLNELHAERRMKHISEWHSTIQELKEDYLKKKREDINEEHRSFLRDWFRKWYDEIKFFYDIPREDAGGSLLVLKHEVPEPMEWFEEYQVYMQEKKANKGKTAHQLKLEKKEAQKEKEMQKREQLIKKKLEAKLMQKMMKNPSMHPGFKYPPSKKTENIIMAVQNYYKHLNFMENVRVDKKYIKTVDINNVYMEVKMEAVKTSDEDMRAELKILKTSLKCEYQRTGETMPEVKQQSKKRGKKQRQRAIISINQKITDQMMDLVMKGFLKKYPKTKLEDYKGDHNYAGDDLRCLHKQAFPYGGEIRDVLWEICEREKGSSRILVVGPASSGKTKTAHAIATLYGAILFELDFIKIASESIDLRYIINTVVTCARAAQPSLIILKHVHRLFYKKIPPEETNLNLTKAKHIIRKSFRKIQKTENVIVVGTCSSPWLTKAQMLKCFSHVILMPDTSYSTVVQILKDWMIHNHTIPSDLNIHNLAYVLQGYTFGFLEESLKTFLTAERLIRIAARGLSPKEIHDYILEFGNDEVKTDYQKYLKWYFDKTQWGKKEMKHLQEQQEFLELTKKWEENMEKKKKTEQKSASGGATGVVV